MRISDSRSWSAGHPTGGPLRWLRTRLRRLAPASRLAPSPDSLGGESLAAASRSLGLAGDNVALQFGRTGVVLTVIAFTLGLFVAAQFQSTSIRITTDPDAQRETAGKTIARLEQEQADIKKQIGELRARLVKEQQQLSSQQSAVAAMSAQLESEKLAAGLVPMKGRGLKVVLDDSATTKIPPKDDPSLYIVHEYQIRDVLNLLWLGGAEAISLNGERIVAGSSVYCVGSTILVNDTRLSPPYEFLAIGDPATLDSLLTDPTNLRSIRPRIKSFGLQFSSSQQREVRVPAYNGTLTVRYSEVKPANAEATRRDAPAEVRP